MAAAYEIVERAVSFRLKRARIEVAVDTAQLLAMLAEKYGTTIAWFLDANILDWLDEATRRAAFVEAFEPLTRFCAARPELPEARPLPETEEM